MKKRRLTTIWRDWRLAGPLWWQAEVAREARLHRLTRNDGERVRLLARRINREKRKQDQS